MCRTRLLAFSWSLGLCPDKCNFGFCTSQILLHCEVVRVHTGQTSSFLLAEKKNLFPDTTVPGARAGLEGWRGSRAYSGDEDAGKAMHTIKVLASRVVPVVDIDVHTFIQSRSHQAPLLAACGTTNRQKWLSCAFSLSLRVAAFSVF